VTAARAAHPTTTLARQLAGLPPHRILQLQGATADEITATMVLDNADLPAALTCRLRPAATQTDLVTALLGELESAAVEMFPTWLPDAADISMPGGAGLVAVRAAAVAHAHRTGQFAPFLSDLAAVALGGTSVARRRFTPEVRAVGLARVVADAFHRTRLVLLVNVPAGLSAPDQQVLAAGCGWLADHGWCGVWLTGAPLATVDWLATATLTASAADVRNAVAAWPAAVGTPHPRSAAEAALEAALATRSWSTGRRWNQTYQSHALRNPVRLDLLWPDERCIVEIDGPEHCEPVRFDADRRRDVQLQLDGHAVLRFTNARVLHDVNAVVTQIGQFILARRRETGKGTG
jgi:very-short-patch-repair endonuclease